MIEFGGCIMFVNEICLLGRLVFMKYTLPGTAYLCQYIDRFEYHSSGEQSCVVEIIFDIIGAESDLCSSDNAKVGEIHGYLLNIDRLDRERKDYDEFFCDGDDISEIYWSMCGGNFGNNNKSKNIFFIDQIKVNKKYRHNKIATASVLMIPKVLYEQFNVNLGYLVAKPVPTLDKPKLQKKDIEIYRRLCDAFWSRLGFASDEKYRYYNTTGDLVGETIARLSEIKYEEYDVLISDDYRFLCEVKVQQDSKEIHIFELVWDTSYLRDIDFPILQDQLLWELQLNELAKAWKWIFYNHLGKVKEFIFLGFVETNVRDDSFYVKMLDRYDYFVAQEGVEINRSISKTKDAANKMI